MELSVREAEVLDLVAERMTNAEIARKLYVSVRTVESHVSSLLRKLGVPDRRALAAYAAEQQAPEMGWRSLGEPSTSFVGREAELAAIASAVADYPLVSLVGPGGVGKTRLALRFATTARAVFADLAVLSVGADGETVARTVAAALGLAEPVDCSALDAVAAELSAVRCVVVLDNCEHVLDGVAALAERLMRTGSARLLATSRERLSVPGERVIVVEPLSEEAAVQLFLDRAATNTGAAQELVATDVAQLCHRLEYLPLLVELAAARLTTFSLEDLLARIDHALGLLGSGGRSGHRHRSVLATLEWSYNLLTPPEQAVYRSLSVLRGPFRLSTGEAVVPNGHPGAAAAHLARLVDGSLLVRVADRYRQFQLVRADAAERLQAAGEEEAARGRLVDWALKTLAAGVPPGDDVDLKAAVEAAEELGHPDLARLAEMLAEHFEAASQWTDAQALYELAARSSRDARSAMAAAELALSRGRGDSAMRLFRFAADLAATSGDADVEVGALVGMAELALRYPGTLNDCPSAEEVDAVLARAEAQSWSARSGSRRAALIAVGRGWQQWGIGTNVRPSVGSAEGGVGTVGAHEPAEVAVAMAEASGDPLLLSSALDCRTCGGLNGGDLAGAMVATSRRVALLSDLADDSPRAWAERRDAFYMASAGAKRLGDFGTSLDYALKYRDLELRRGHPRGGLEAVMAAQFFLARWDELIDDANHLLTVRQGEAAWGTGHLGEPWAYTGAVLGYRGHTEEAEQWFGRAKFRGDPDPWAWLIPCLRADVELHHGRAAEAQDFLQTRSQDINGWWRSLYAAVRAEAFGGDEIDEAVALVGDDAHAAAILARAQGKLEAAREGFRKCGAVYQWARTTLQMGGPDVDEALATYEALGLRT
jgi:predicted ATPase/DNA-binding CsgD family transcriptional regulator